MAYSETWYELQSSQRGANDWFSINESADTLEAAFQKLANRTHYPQFEYRIVKVTRTEEPCNS